MDNETINDEIEQSILERWFFSQGMFAKDEGAARKFLLMASEELLEGGVINPALRITLGQALREAALCKDNNAASDVLLKSFGLKKGGSDLKLIQAARAGATNTELADQFNVGKNEIPKKLKAVKSQEIELLNRRLSHTVQRLLLILSEMEWGAQITEVTKHLREYLTAQNLLVSSDDIEKHVQDVLILAQKEELILLDEADSLIFRNKDKLP